MKKKYIKPEAVVTTMEPVSMYASSPNADATMGVHDNRHADEELSRERRGTWGNLW